MKNKICQKVLKRIVMFVAPLVFLLSIMSSAQAEQYNIDLNDYNLSVWNITDIYDYYEYDQGTSVDMYYTMNHDAKGKVTGSGAMDFDFGVYGIPDIYIPLEIKSKVNGKNGIVTLKFKLKGNGQEIIEGQKLTLKISINGTLELDQEGGYFYGPVKVKIGAKANGRSDSESFEDLWISYLPYNMTGEARLMINVGMDEKGKKLEGTSELILSNGVFYNLFAKGKYNSNQDETMFKLKSADDFAKGIKVKLKIDEGSDAATFINGKVLGQQLKYKLE